MAGTTSPTRAIRTGMDHSLRVVFYILFVLTTALLMTFPYLAPSEYQAQTIGDVTGIENHAPYTLTYQSLLLTDNAKDIAANNIAPIYL
jgi:hypothetical protein